MADPVAKAVKTYLAAHASLVGETVRAGRPTDREERGIWVMATGGFPGIWEAGGDDVTQPTVQVLVRTGKGQGDAAETLAMAVHDALIRAEVTGYTRCVPSAPPIELKPDALGRPEWSINAQLTLIE